MNTPKKILLTTLAIGMLASNVTSCRQPVGPDNPIVKPVVTQLAAPENLRIEGTTTLRWNSVPNAVGFRIYVNGVSRQEVGNITSFNLADLNLPVGSTSGISIRALADPKNELFTDSNHTNEVSFTVREQTTDQIELATPTGLRIEPGTTILRWNPVHNAAGFHIIVNGIVRNEVFGDDITSFDLAVLGLTPGETFDISIRALADPESKFTDSRFSETVEFEVPEPNVTDQLATPDLIRSGNALSWGHDADAVGFRIYVRNRITDEIVREIPVGQGATGFDLSSVEPPLPVGEFSISVRALADTNPESKFTDSEPSNSVDFEVKEHTTTPTEPLNPPTGLGVNHGTTLEWNFTGSAAGFRIYVGTTQYVINDGNARSFDLRDLVPALTPETPYDISIRALADEEKYNSPKTGSISYILRCHVSNKEINNLGNCPEFNCSTNALVTFPGGDEVSAGGFLAGDGRANIAYLINILNCFTDDAARKATAGQPVPLPYASWGAWVEARITDAIQAAELAVAINPALGGYDGTLTQLFPGIVMGQGMGGMLNGVNIWPLTKDQRRLENFNLESLVPGFIIVNQAANSFAAVETIGSGMIVHERFHERTIDLGMRPEYVKPDGSRFPCIPMDTINDAVRFHRIAVENIHNLGDYVVDGTPILAHTGVLLHNVFDHFKGLVTSPRFTNNPAGMPFGGSSTDPAQRNRAFGLRFSADGIFRDESGNVVDATPLGRSDDRQLD